MSFDPWRRHQALYCRNCFSLSTAFSKNPTACHHSEPLSIGFALNWVQKQLQSGPTGTLIFRRMSLRDSVQNSFSKALFEPAHQLSLLLRYSSRNRMVPSAFVLITGLSTLLPSKTNSPFQLWKNYLTSCVVHGSSPSWISAQGTIKCVCAFKMWKRRLFALIRAYLNCW